MTESPTQTGPEFKGKKHRSPNYPAIGLPKSIERIREFYDAWKRAEVPILTVQERWHFKPYSGAANQAVAAIKAFGLIDFTGHGQKRLLKLSEAALKILGDHPDKQRLLQEAALSPPIYAELWNKYGADDLPPNETIRQFLLWDRNFNPEAVDSVIAEFRDTIGLAMPEKPDIIDSTDEGGADDPQGAGHRGVPPAPPGSGKTKTVPPRENMVTDTFTLDEGVITLQYPKPLSQEGFNDFKAWVDLEFKRIERSLKASKDASADPPANA